MALRRSLPVVMVALMMSAAGIAVGCASGPTEPSSAARPETTPVSPSASGIVSVTRDVRFAPAPSAGAWTDRVLDLYAPADARGAPLVVLFTAHRTTKDAWQQYADLATDLAQRGVVVAVANWSQLDVDESTVEAVLRVVAEGRAVQACAVTVAASGAVALGADPSRLVVMGQFYGGNLAALTALAPWPAPLPGCEGTGGRPATGLLVWDGDWTLGMDLWDRQGAGAARIVAALTPWVALPAAPHIPVGLAYSRNTATAARRCEAGTSPRWLALRDPSGAMRRQLMSVDAFADGCVDIGDEAKAMAAAMRADGIPASVLELQGRGTSEEAMDPADRVALVDAAVRPTTAA